MSTIQPFASTVPDSKAKLEQLLKAPLPERPAHAQEIKPRKSGKTMTKAERDARDARIAERDAKINAILNDINRRAHDKRMTPYADLVSRRALMSVRQIKADEKSQKQWLARRQSSAQAYITYIRKHAGKSLPTMQHNPAYSAQVAMRIRREIRELDLLAEMMSPTYRIKYVRVVKGREIKCERKLTKKQLVTVEKSYGEKVALLRAVYNTDSPIWLVYGRIYTNFDGWLKAHFADETDDKRPRGKGMASKKANRYGRTKATNRKVVFWILRENGTKVSYEKVYESKTRIVESASSNKTLKALLTQGCGYRNAEKVEAKADADEMNTRMSVIGTAGNIINLAKNKPTGEHVLTTLLYVNKDKSISKFTVMCSVVE